MRPRGARSGRAELRHLGFAVERWMAGDGFPALAAHRSATEPAPTLGFNGHLDVVPIEDPAKWQSDPWGGAQFDQRVYGRGACDAKGAVVAMIGALRLLQELVATATNLLLHMVTDEEVAGRAPIAAWSEAGRMRSSSASRAHSTSGLPNPGWSSYASRSTASPPTPSTAGAPSRTRRAAKRVASTPSTRPSSLPRRCVTWSGMDAGAALSAPARRVQHDQSRGHCRRHERRAWGDQRGGRTGQCPGRLRARVQHLVLPGPTPRRCPRRVRGTRPRRLFQRLVAGDTRLVSSGPCAG